MPGLPTDRFLFLGFLPAKAKARADAIAEVADMRATLVLYESGPRLGDTLARACSTQLGDRDAAVAREITKLHEECVTGALGELAERYADDRSEGRDRDRRRAADRSADVVSDDELDAALDEALASFRLRAPPPKSPNSSASPASALTPARSSGRE